MTTSVSAAESNKAMKEDKKQVNDWNSFASELYALHKDQLSRHDVKETVRMGGYRGKKDFYREVTYTDAQTGRVLSRIQWETENPENIHVIEVFQHDESGRVSCDYTAAFLPGFRNAPVQTLVALHSYNEGLHAFRSFDASGDAVFERCNGVYKGKEIDFDFEDYEIEDLRNDPNGIMKTAEYQACFGKIDLSAAEFLPPLKR
jgi:hypothetical protein